MSEDFGYITFALAKGRLAELALDRLAEIGIEFEDFSKKSRKLLFVNEEKKIKFFLSKADDVPTYVEYGAADIGVAGKDTIAEGGKNIYELAELGFGACRMVVAGKTDFGYPGAADIRVATKYPNIARRHFHDVRHQNVEIIKLHGSVELAPIVGLADVIVDIVETGDTLRENGLVVLEEINQVSARLIVNSVSMKLEHARISEIVRLLNERRTV